MAEQTTREVCVLAPFTDAEGVEHVPGDTFVVAYQSERQRRKVNQMIYRGFLTFDLKSAQGLKKD